MGCRGDCISDGHASLEIPLILTYSGIHATLLALRLIGNN
jgi:hypothetical protein